MHCPETSNSYVAITWQGPKTRKLISERVATITTQM